jgi:hypothetical protein
MVFHQDGQSFYAGIKGGTVRQSPGFQHAVHFQTQVIMETAGAVPLDEKPVALILRDGRFRFRRLAENALSPVFIKWHS